MYQICPALRFMLRLALDKIHFVKVLSISIVGVHCFVLHKIKFDDQNVFLPNVPDLPSFKVHVEIGFEQNSFWKSIQKYSDLKNSFDERDSMLIEMPNMKKIACC